MPQDNDTPRRLGFRPTVRPWLSQAPALPRDVIRDPSVIQSPRRQACEDDYPRGEFLGQGTIAQLTEHAPAAGDAEAILAKLVGVAEARLAGRLDAGLQGVHERINEVERDLDRRVHAGSQRLYALEQLHDALADHVGRRIDELARRAPSEDGDTATPGDCSAGRHEFQALGDRDAGASWVRTRPPVPIIHNHGQLEVDGPGRAWVQGCDGCQRERQATEVAQAEIVMLEQLALDARRRANRDLNA